MTDQESIRVRGRQKDTMTFTGVSESDCDNPSGDNCCMDTEDSEADCDKNAVSSIIMA